MELCLIKEDFPGALWPDSQLPKIPKKSSVSTLFRHGLFVLEWGNMSQRAIHFLLECVSLIKQLRIYTSWRVKRYFDTPTVTLTKVCLADRECDDSDCCCLSRLSQTSIHISFGQSQVVIHKYRYKLAQEYANIQSNCCTLLLFAILTIKLTELTVTYKSSSFGKFPTLW